MSSIALPRAAPSALRALLATIDALALVGGVVAACALAGLTALILLEVGFRFVSGFVDWVPPGMPNAWEYSAYLMGIAFLCGSAMTLRAGAHIRVSILMANLGPRLQRWLEIFACTIGVGLTGFLAYSLVRFTLGSFARGQTSISSDTPIWIPQALLATGAVLLALQVLARLLQAVWSLPLERAEWKASSFAEH